MRKSFFFCLLVATALFAQSIRAQAAPRCLHFTNFCDTISLESSGILAYGGWDALCEGNWSRSSVIGNWKSRPELGTRPVFDFNYVFPYTMQFLFKADKLFDLYATDGTADGVFAYDTNEPYTITGGACLSTDANKTKPTIMSRVNNRTAPRKSVATRCLHFTNYCDTIVLASVGPLLYGNWDFQCIGDWSSASILGDKKLLPELSTRPVSPDYLSPYTVQFSLKPGNLFDLYETTGLHMGVFAARKDQPYTLTNGSCTSEDVDRRQPRILSR